MDIGALIRRNAVLFNEELGAVIQVKADRAGEVIQQFTDANINAHLIGTVNRDNILARTAIFYSQTSG